MVDAIMTMPNKFLDIILLAESSGLDFSILIREINKQAEKDFCFQSCLQDAHHIRIRQIPSGFLIIITRIDIQQALLKFRLLIT